MVKGGGLGAKVGRSVEREVGKVGEVWSRMIAAWR